MLTVDTMQTHTYRIIIYQSTPEPILDNQGFFYHGPCAYKFISSVSSSVRKEQYQLEFHSKAYNVRNCLAISNTQN